MGNPIFDGDGHVDRIPADTTPEQKWQATRYVARKAHDTTDAWQLLDALGLTETARDVAAGR